MKNVKKLLGIILLMTLFTVKVAYANELRWEDLPGHHNQSILLNDETAAKDIVENSARGRFLATAMLEIRNEQNGNLHIDVDTLTHVYVDRIYQVVFLDVWDESENSWKQIAEWTFDKVAEEGENLSSNDVGFTVTDFPVNRYYRDRAMHLVQIGDDMEGKATETNGVLLTDHEV